MSGSIEESAGTLYITNYAGSVTTLNIGSAAAYTGQLQVGLNPNGTNTQDLVTVDVWVDLFSGSMEIGPEGTVDYIYGTSPSGKSSTGDVYGPIASGGTYSASFVSGATLNFSSDGTVSSNPNLTMKASITGNLNVNVNTTTVGSDTYKVNLLTNGYNITGCVVLDLGSTINMSGGGTLTLVENQAGTAGSQIFGDIIGSGNIVIASNSLFGTSSDTYPTNSFSALTLTVTDTPRE